MDILNKTAIRDKMKSPPPGQRLFEAFNGNWDKLTDGEVNEIYSILCKEFIDIKNQIENVIFERKNS